jgi:uncharacterized phage protein (TIGR01671 family)
MRGGINMRKIKFRGKRVDNGDWICGSMYRIAEELNPFIMLVNRHCESYEVDAETIGEYTNSCDKNSREIYESDILSDGKELYLVKYSFTETGMIAKGLGKEGTWSLYHLATNHNKGREIEVIGNTHDNSELITAKTSNIF